MLVGMPTATPSLPVEHHRRPAPKSSVTGLRAPAKAPFPKSHSTGVPCQQEDPALWFSHLPAELNLAKAFCRGCHNRESCLAGALERAEPIGVWGGEIFEDGRIIEFKRPRGRPRKPRPDDGN
jgi:WhiB family transcriptional regulator, redox-sensing transcriptional regulator